METLGHQVEQREDTFWRWAGCVSSSRCSKSLVCSQIPPTPPPPLHSIQSVSALKCSNFSIFSVDIWNVTKALLDQWAYALWNDTMWIQKLLCNVQSAARYVTSSSLRVAPPTRTCSSSDDSGAWVTWYTKALNPKDDLEETVEWHVLPSPGNTFPFMVSPSDGHSGSTKPRVGTEVLCSDLRGRGLALSIKAEPRSEVLKARPDL